MDINEVELRRIIREELERALGDRSVGSPEPTVGAAEIAKYLGVSVYTARIKAQTGVIPAFKVGKQWRYFLSEVKAHLSAQSADPWAASPRSAAARKSWQTRRYNQQNR
ncbi:helix-turn-helix domain-containing protein [Leifsonia sp. NPDC058292]|uniref:helix-turn-helix domain-containing protein n=1 Tax=Leifsonia sp. NPDC058292 TaxID=3346428 RepID=UPI0036DA9717